MRSITVLLLVALTVHPTTMMQIGLRDLATGAEKIVQATVTAIVPQWNAERTVIYTYIRMVIKDDLIGADEDNEIIIKQPGGTIGSLTLAIEGSASYKVGEENILFLSKDNETSGAFQTLGMYQGKYKVFTDANQVARVTQDTTQHRTLYKRSAVQETGNSMTLEEFKQLVISYRNNSAQ